MFTRMILTAMLLVSFTLVCGGCNTIEGVGRDVSAAGDTVSGAARETRESLEDN